jgi:hypothetical protein
MSEAEEDARKILIAALESGEADIHKLQPETILFDAKEEREIEDIGNDLVKHFNAQGVQVPDGIIAMMVMASQHLNMIADEDAAQDMRMMCVSILFGNYEFQGEPH